jgi:hypothetical protein
MGRARAFRTSVCCLLACRPRRRLQTAAYPGRPGERQPSTGERLLHRRVGATGRTGGTKGIRQQREASTR